MIVRMTAALLLVVLGQAPCAAQGADVVREAQAHAAAFDLDGAVRRLREAPPACRDAHVAAAYLAGLQAAREAYRVGGDPASLAPARQMEAVLMGYEADGSAPAAIARVVLMAAAAAAQSERDDMRVLLDHALQLERLQLAAGAPPAPLVTAHEAAGDLWLQVHRFAAARDAYQLALEMVGNTPRVRLGLARAARRLDEPASACQSYAELVALAPSAPSRPELAEAREYLGSGACPGSR
jgi:hypothetical protein